MSVNPYSVFFDWLFDGADSEIPDVIIENKSRFSIHYLLNLFMKNRKVCLYVNKYLNNFHCVGLPIEDFFRVIKFVIQQFNLSKFDLFHSKFIHINRDKEILEFISRYPFLKYNEASLIYDKYKSEVINNICSKKISTKKIKKEKLRFEEIIEQFKDIKNSCSECALIKEPLCLFDTNSKSNISNIDIMFVGEAPGKSEAEKGIPFVGASGELLRKYIKEFIIKNKIKFFITNSVLCRPPDNKISPEYVTSCHKNLDKLIEMINPKLIVTVGAISMKRLGMNGKITENHGKIFKYNNKNLCFPLVHPAAILRGVYSENIYKEDFKLLVMNFERGECI